MKVRFTKLLVNNVQTLGVILLVKAWVLRVCSSYALRLESRYAIIIFVLDQLIQSFALTLNGFNCAFIKYM